MGVYYNAVYTKTGAVFADGNAAQADKSQFFSSELQYAVDNCFATMLANGVLLEPITHVWDQDTFSLTTVKHVSSAADYSAALTFNTQQVKDAAVQAGWTFVSPQ